jgi:hypothetical protein
MLDDIAGQHHVEMTIGKRDARQVCYQSRRLNMPYSGLAQVATDNVPVLRQFVSDGAVATARIQNGYDAVGN